MGSLARAAERPFELLGPGGGGSIFAPAISPHDPKFALTSCDMSGFYRSHDGGRHWRMYDTRMIKGSTVCRPAFHPRDPHVIYMGNESALMMSADGGETFALMLKPAPWKGQTIQVIHLDRGRPEVMFVGTDKSLWRSEDAGKTFAACDGVSGAVIGIHADQSSPASARVVACATAGGVYVSSDGGRSFESRAAETGAVNGFAGASDAKSSRWFVAAKSGVQTSTDRGKTWSACKNGLPNNPFRFATMAENNPNICYAADDAVRFGVYKTADGGASWRRVFSLYRDEKAAVQYGWVTVEFNPGWGGPALGLAASASDPNRVLYVNMGELYGTDTGGDSWFCGYSQPATQNVKGAAWESVGLEVTTSWDYVFDPFDRNAAWICYTDIGLARTEDRGQTWSYCARTSPWPNTTYALMPDPKVRGTLYAAASNTHDIPGWSGTAVSSGSGGVMMSADNGRTWKSISEGLPVKQFPCTSLVMDPTSDPQKRTLYTVMYGDGVYKSVDGGASWKQASQGLLTTSNRHTYTLRRTADGALYCMITGVRADKRSTVFGEPGGLYKSTDGAQSWTCITQGQKIYWPMEFCIDGKNPNLIWIAAADASGGKGSGGLYATRDGGKTWQWVLKSSDFDHALSPYIHAFAVSQNPAHPGVMYLSTWTHGLHISLDNGQHWKPFKGIPFLVIDRVVCDPHDPSTIIVTTYGGGVWRGPWNGF